MKSKRNLKSAPLIITIALLLVVSLVGNIIQLRTRSVDDQHSPYIELGKMTQAKNTGVKAKLKTFLTSQSNNGCSGITSSGKSYEQVTEVSNDQTQVRIKYGCYHPDSSAIVIYKNGEWLMTDTTNQWDEYGNPSCAMATKFSVGKKLAPVCFTDDGTYLVR